LKFYIIIFGCLMIIGLGSVFAGPVMQLTPSSLNYGSTTTELWFHINNTGDQYLDWSIGSKPLWLSLDPGSGPGITPEESLPIKATVNRTSMGPHDYTGTIYVNSNGGNGNIGVTMTVPGLTINSTSGGSVTSPGEGNFNRDYGEMVSIVAQSQAGYEFTGWSGDVGSVANTASASTTITVYGYHQITATFAQPPVLDVDPLSLDFGTEQTELFVNIGNTGGQPLTWELEQNLPSWLGFQATGAAGPGQTFPYLATVDRSGLDPGSYQHTLLIVSNDGSEEIEVTMEVGEGPPEVYLLTISSTEGGHVSEPGEGLFEHSPGEEVTITAVADQGWAFAGWSGDVESISNPDSPGTAITMLGNHIIEATFATGLPSISVEPPEVVVESPETEGIATISNSGTGTLEWEMVANLPPWLCADPTAGTLSHESGSNVTFTVDRTGMSPGEHMHAVGFESSGGYAEIEIYMIVPEPLSLVSPFAHLPPVIDGTLTAGEWNRSAGLEIDSGYLRVQNDASSVYVLLDVTGDTGLDPSDYVWVSFDVDLDGSITPGIDLNYRASPGSGRLGVQDYLGEGWSALEESYSRYASGYGKSLQSRVNHRFWEIAFSLPEVGSTAGGAVGIGMRVGSGDPSIDEEIPEGFYLDLSNLVGINLSKRDLDLLVLADEDFIEELVPLKTHKDYTGIDTYVQSWQALNASFGPTGGDVQERIKRGVAAYKSACGIDYLMLVGDSDRFPVRYCKIYDPAHWGNNWAPADLYYADLYEGDGSFEDWDGDGDGLFGEMDGIPWQSGYTSDKINLDDVDYHPDIAVGRVPASTEKEVTKYVNKVISYEFNSYDSSWSDRALMIVPSYYEEEHDKYYDFPGGWETKEYVSDNLTSAGLDVVKLYASNIADLPAGLSDGEPTRDSITDEMNEGVGFVNFAGHGNINGWAYVYDSYSPDLNFRATEKWHDYFCVGDELPVVGDFDGDGRDDIAAFVRSSKTGSGKGDVYVALSTGSGFGPGKIWHGNFCIGDEIPRAGDFDGDGKDDVACFVRNESDVYVALSTGSSFAAAVRWQDYFCLPGEWPEVGDFDGDGRDDIVTFVKGTKSGSAANDVYVSVSNGTTFLPGKKWHDSFSWGSEIPFTGDFDGDGKDDIITFKRQAADVYIALSDGNGFGSGQLWHKQFCLATEEPGIGDFDGDGRDDIVCFSRQGGGKVWVSISTGTKFNPARTRTSGFCLGKEVPLTGDFRGEGSDGVINFVRDERTGSGRADVYIANPVRLDNADRLPIIFASACNTAQFHYSGRYLDVDGDEFNPSVECPPCCGWTDNRCWPMNPQAPDAPEPGPLQRNSTKSYDVDSMAEVFLVRYDVGAVGYIGCYTGSQPAELSIDKFFHEAYLLSSKPAVLGDLWNRALEEFIGNDYFISWVSTSSWAPQAYFHHPQKIQLYGDPSLRVGGVSRTQRENSTGTWSMVHDGWRGNLSLWESEGDPIEGTPNVEGNYTGADGKIHGVEGWMRSWDYQMPSSWGPDHKIEFYIDFPDSISSQDDQRFEGYIFTNMAGAMAGKTWWHGRPFGFYALEDGVINYETDAPGQIERSDFLGTYRANINGVEGVLQLWPGTEGSGIQPNVEGRFASGGKTYSVWGYVRTPSNPMPTSWGPDHKIEFYVDFTDVFVIVDKFEGYLFTQTGGAMAGVVWSFGTPYGFYAEKVADHVVKFTGGPGGSVTLPGEGIHTYNSGDVVSLTATPSQGYRFSLWTGDVETISDVESPQTTMTVYGNCSITANFTRGDGPPVIVLGPSVVCGQSWACVSWTTDEDADGEVRYDFNSGAYGSSGGHARFCKVHTVNITGLEPSTNYHYAVVSTDPEGNYVTSLDGLFRTKKPLDEEDPQVNLLSFDGELNGTSVVHAEATDNVGVSRVVFYLNGVRTFTDYSPPYQWPFDTAVYVDGNYTITAKAYDDYGRSSADTEEVQTRNDKDPEAPQVHIGSWGIGEEKAVFWISLSDDNGLSTAHVYVDGVQEQTEGFPSNPQLAKVEFKWDTKSLPKGVEYRIGVVAYDVDGKTGMDTVDVLLPSVPKLEPNLVVTSREFTRVSNFFTVEITVKNAGKGNATNVVLQDFHRLFQPISRNSSFADYMAEYNPSARWWDCTILCKVEIPAGESRVFTYNAVPVLVQSNPPKPSAGELRLYYESTKGKDFSGKYTAGASVEGGGSLEKAYWDATKLANYLIVTNPSRMLYYHKYGDIQELLSTMAEFAMAKHGALGYLDKNSAADFDKLIVPKGSWAKALSPGFSKVGQGYLLIVGETEIVPSWHEYGFDIEWNNAADTKDVPLTDHYYSDTTGDGSPELIVGRIIGNRLVDLTATINRSLAIHLGQTDPGYDRSHALLVSGTGYKQDTFTGDVAKWAKTLTNKGIKTSELHLKWYSTHDKKASAFNQSIPGMDIILYSGHGDMDGWDDIECGLTGNPSWWRIPNDFPLDFGTTSPVVIAIACLTGNYEAIDDYNIAEGFLDSGATVYVGSTQVSSIQQGSKVGSHLLGNWDSSESIGKAFLDTERSRWTSDKYGRLFVWEFNIYGDPKFGAVPSLSSDDQENPEIMEELSVTVPQYTLSKVEGLDLMEIPGGWLWMEEGKPLVPYYVRTYSCPADVVVQDVRLVDRSATSNLTGLNLAVTTNDGRSGGQVGSQAAGCVWYPGWDYTWTELENPDGTSDLVIQVFPLQYDQSTGDACFHGEFSFDIDYSSSAVGITGLDTDSAIYEPGEAIDVNIAIECAGDGMDVIVDASIRRFSSGEFVAGLLLEDLADLEGPASFSISWNPGDETGHYFVQVELRDQSGLVLDRKTDDFLLGEVECEIIDYDVSLVDGRLEGLSMVVSNQGTRNLSGAGVFVIRDESGTMIAEVLSEFVDLAPLCNIELVGDLQGPVAGSSYVTMHVLHDGRSTDPVTWSAIGEPGTIVLSMLAALVLVLRRTGQVA